MTISDRFLALFHRFNPDISVSTDASVKADDTKPGDNSALYGTDLRAGISSLKVTDQNYQKMEGVREEIINDVQHSNISKIEELFDGFRSLETKQEAARDLTYYALNYYYTSLEMIEFLGSIGGINSLNFSRVADVGTLNNPDSTKRIKVLGSMMPQKEKDQAVQRWAESAFEHFAKGHQSLAEDRIPEITLIIAAGANPDATPYKNDLSARAIADEAYIQGYAGINTAILDGLKLQREWRAEAMGSKRASVAEAKLATV